MNGPNDNEKDTNGLFGPSESDLERFGGEDEQDDLSEEGYLLHRKREARSALWKLIAGAVFMLLVASMLLNVLLPALSRVRRTESAPERVPAVVTRVFDGRTIAIEIDGIESTVRYIGVETPVFGDPLYELAIAANREWTIGQQVLLEADEQNADAEGRLLRYVWLDGAMINLNLLATGLSKVTAFNDNERYRDVFREVEEGARSQNLGIWKQPENERSASLLSRTLPLARIAFYRPRLQAHWRT
jgi:micrococcal nuclease